MDLGTLQSKVNRYEEIIGNTSNYRKDWNESLKSMITSGLEEIINETKLKATIEVKDEVENLEVIVLSLGQDISGIAEKLQNSVSKRHMIKNKGALIYQQLFNGKIMILIMFPFIEGYGEPKPPKTIEILRPEELKKAFLIRHVEEFMTEVINWEDYDDDLDEQVKSNPIGFNLIQPDSPGQ